MSWEKLHKTVRKNVKHLQRFADFWWFTPVLGLLAVIDMFVVIIPVDGLAISSTLLRPHRWFSIGAFTAVGNTIGAMILAYLVHHHGLPWILQIFPGLDQSHAWTLTLDFFQRFGLYLVFAVALAPMMQQPSIILAVVGGTPLATLAAVILAGRLIKYLLIAYVASHAPRLLSKMWGVQEELEEVGVHIPPETKPEAK